LRLVPRMLGGAFLAALADEAEDALDLLFATERA
jgi:hypothetical protein